MTPDPLDLYEDLIIDELCAYQSQLDRGEVGGSDSACGRVIPADLQPALSEFRRCLDLIHDVRAEANPKSGSEDTSAYAPRHRGCPDGLTAFARVAHAGVGATDDSRLDAVTTGASARPERPGHPGQDGDIRGAETAPQPGETSVPFEYALPSQIGRFKIIALLGTGGFGIVYRGIDSLMGREVAIKIPRPELLANSELMERFAREAIAVARLEHPNIVPVYESDFHGIIPYIVTPYISGKTLAAWISVQSQVSIRHAVEIVRQLANGVAHAHEHGVLHRDLKPGNVLLASREDSSSSTTSDTGDKAAPMAKYRVGRNELPFIPKLNDFGLAKCDSPHLSETRTGAVIGTLCYMSPEQAEGRSRDITARSDVYGLGAILYELLTGAPPFQGANEFQTVQRILQDDPVSLRIKVLELPADLEVICLKCLEKVPTNRYPSATALSEDLQRFLNGEPIWARPISRIARMGKWCRRHPLPTTFIAAGTLGLVTLVSLSLWYNSRLTTLLEIAKRDREAARQSALEATRRAYFSDMRNAEIHWDQANVAQMLKLLDRYRPRDGEPDVRDFAWWYLWREYNDASRVLGQHENKATAVAMTGNGELAASGGGDSVIRLWSLPVGTLFGELRGHDSGNIESLDFSPDGDRLVSAGEDGTVRIWDVAKRQELFVRREHQSLVSQAVYSPQGDVIASGGGDQMIRLWNSQTGAPIGIMSGHTKRVRCLAFHPTEPLLATGSLDETIRIWNYKELVPDHRVEDGIIWSGPAFARVLAFDPNGANLFVGKSSSSYLMQLSFQDPTLGKVLNETLLGSGPRGLSWPRGGVLALAMNGAEIRVANRFVLESHWERLRGHQDAVRSVAANADSSSFVSASEDGTVRYWPQVNGRARIPVDDLDGNPSSELKNHSLQWCKPFLAADFQEGKMLLFRMPERKLERTFTKSNDEVFTLSASGNLILSIQSNGELKCLRTSDGESRWSRQLPSWELTDRHPPLDLCAIDSAENLGFIICANEIVVISLQTSRIVHHLVHPPSVTSTLVNSVYQVKLVEKPGEPLCAISTCADGIIRCWDVEKGTVLRQVDSKALMTFCMTVSQDQRLVTTIDGDMKIHISRVDDLVEIDVIPSSRSLKVCFLRGSETMLLDGEIRNKLTLWSLGNESESMVIPLQTFSATAISPDGHQIAVMQQRQIRILDGTPQ